MQPVVRSARPAAPRVPWADGKFKTASGRFVFPDRLDDDPVLPPADYPLHLLAIATKKATNSQILEARQEGVAVARVHPRRAAAEGFADGDLVDLVSARPAVGPPGARPGHASGHRAGAEAGVAEARPLPQRAHRAVLHRWHGRRLQPELRPPRALLIGRRFPEPSWLCPSACRSRR